MQSHSLTRFFNNYITIYRKKGEGDAFGGVSQKWDKYLWEIPVRIHGQSGASFRIAMEGKEFAVDKKMICERDLDVQRGDKIKDDNAGDIYIVIGIKPIREVKKIHHLECYLSRIEAIE